MNNTTETRPNHYYAVWGDNAIAVFTDYYKAYAEKDRFSKFKCQKFKTYMDAKYYACMRYDELQTEDIYKINDNLDMVKMGYNWIVTKHVIRKLNMKRLESNQFDINSERCSLEEAFHQCR